ncbi:DUF1508 domain-containing protein [Phenylobacterium sp.]|uniref:YegP family protein n=1 Tax=Phenylobacterium sp. TaxID=1871053 RepID=UPI003BACC04F
MATRPYPSFLIDVNNSGDFFWHLQAANGKIIAYSGEGYKNLADCEAGIALVQASKYPVWETQAVTSRRR